MTLEKHLSILVPTKPFAVRYEDVEAVFPPGYTMPDVLKNTVMKSVKKDHNTGLWVYEVEEGDNNGIKSDY